MILPLGKLVRYRTGLFAATVLVWMLASCLPLLTGLFGSDFRWFEWAYDPAGVEYLGTRRAVAGQRGHCAVYGVGLVLVAPVLY